MIMQQFFGVFFIYRWWQSTNLLGLSSWLVEKQPSKNFFLEVNFQRTTSSPHFSPTLLLNPIQETYLLTKVESRRIQADSVSNPPPSCERFLNQSRLRVTKLILIFCRLKGCFFLILILYKVLTKGKLLTKKVYRYFGHKILPISSQMNEDSFPNEIFTTSVYLFIFYVSWELSKCSHSHW